MERAELYQKIAGCLMAGALGDALGYEVEFISWDAIRRRFGECGIQNLVPEDGKARFSDDIGIFLQNLKALRVGTPCDGDEKALAHGLAVFFEAVKNPHTNIYC
jgi:ADP-ribosylglycohydrolase